MCQKKFKVSAVFRIMLYYYYIKYETLLRKDRL